MSVRAKFKVNSIESSLYRRVVGGNTVDEELRTVKLSPVGSDGSPENKQFWAWTPVGKIELGTINPQAWEPFVLGGEFYVDFTLA